MIARAAGCCFPDCPEPPTTTNREGQPTCAYHRPVVVLAFLPDEPEGRPS